jgi:hypothetical protein
MERSARKLGIVAALFALSFVPAASAKPKPPQVLHPKFHIVADGIGAVAAASWVGLGVAGPVAYGSRYVVLAPAANPAPPFASPAPPFAIDEQTGQRVTSGAAGCQTFNVVGPDALFAWCAGVSPGPGTFAIHDLTTGAYRTLALSPEIQHFDDGSTDCGALPVLLGDDWLEFDQQCDKPDGTAAFSHDYVFENTHTGAFASLPAWKSGGRIVPNLNSPQLGQRLCPSLRTPARAPTAMVVDGSFAIASEATYIDTARDRIYLRRCGTRLHMRIRLGAEFSIVGANSHAVVWEVDNGGLLGQFSGVFLPSLRRFSFWFPHRLAVDQVAYALGELRMYVLDGNGRVWAAPIHLRPARS